MKPKRKAIGRTGKDGTKSVKIRVEVKYLSNFWRTLEKPWINCEKNLTLTWSNRCFIIDTLITSQEKTFKITDTKPYAQVNPGQDGIFRSCSWRGGGREAKSPPSSSLKSVIHIIQWWNLENYTSPKDDPKNMWVTRCTPWVLLTSAFFHWKSANLAISENTDTDWILLHNF